MLKGVEWHRITYRDQRVRILERNSNLSNAVSKSKETICLRDFEWGAFWDRNVDWKVNGL